MGKQLGLALLEFYQLNPKAAKGAADAWPAPDAPACFPLGVDIVHWSVAFVSGCPMSSCLLP